jgi:predicted CopG family antitoxin
MENKTIKISEENYRWLLKIASDLQKEHGKVVTFDSAINSLKKGNIKKNKNIMDFAGIWEDMTDKEAEKIKKDLKNGWGKWKIPSL